VQLAWRAAGALLLLLLTALTAHADGGRFRYSLDTLFYGDTDGVMVFTPQVAVHGRLDDEGGEASARILVDTISAASVDVISEASKRFSEVRTEGDLAVSKRFGPWLPQLRYRASSEADYLSQGGGASVERRLFSADTVLSLSTQLTFDTIGRSGIPFSQWSRSLTSGLFEASVTQTIDPRTVIRGIYSLTVQSGYMEKPYRYVPLFDQAGIDAAKAMNVRIDLGTFNQFRLPQRPPEEVPDERVRHAIGVRLMRWMPSLDASLRADYRFYVDSWGVLAHTLEVGTIFPLSPKYSLELSNRAYLQSAASFYQREYVVTDGTAPKFRTVDRDLGSYAADTVSARLDRTRGALTLSVGLDLQYTRFFDFLFLDSRVAAVTLFSVRWEP
jgi:hypothetical protein